jgi:hypothetical protein
MPVIMFLCFSTCFAQSVRQEANGSVKFEVSPPRFMTPEEHKRTGDNLDPDLAMKCRVSNQGKVTVYLYTDFANHIVPRGNRVRKTDKGHVWMLGSSGRESLTSPGFSPLKSGSWLTLFDGDAVEWDCGEISTPTEEVHAMTVFMKIGGEDKQIVEVFSNYYKVPAKKNK